MFGERTNIGEQSDAREFLSKILDHVEVGIKDSAFRNILQSVFGGKFQTQLKCSGCGFIKYNDEAFLNVSLTVKNMKTLTESWDHAIKGETIPDFLCDNCKKKCEFVKRGCIGELPNILIVHLQRIVYDMETFMLMKIHSRLEFPQELNLEPYTVEGIKIREELKDQQLQL